MRVGVRVGFQDHAFEPLTTRLLPMLNALSTSYSLHARDDDDDVAAKQETYAHMIPFSNTVLVSLSRLSTILEFCAHSLKPSQ